MRSQITQTVTIAQAGQTLQQAVRIYFAKDRTGQYRMERRRARPICLLGPAGIGKTELVRQIAEENGLAFLSYSITHHTRQSIIGLPKLVDEEIGGQRCAVTEYTMSEIIAQVHRTMKETGRQEGILFLDEFNCASETLRPILLQLLQDKSFGPHRIPDGWMLVLAGNPTEYNRSASDLDAVTADRMRLLHIQPDYAAWRAYMLTRQVHPVVLTYLDNNRDHFYVYRHTGEGTALVTARGWEDLSQMMGFLEQEGEQPDLTLVAQYIQCAEVARSFYTFYARCCAASSSGLVDRILEGDPKAVSALQRLSFEGGWSLVSALLRRVQTMADDAAELDATTAGVHTLLKGVGARLASQPEAQLDNLIADCARQAQDIPVHRFLLDCLPLAMEEDGWERIRSRFARELKEPRTQTYAALSHTLENLIATCRAGLEGKPHLEFLFNSLCDSESLSDLLSTPQFRALLQDVCFDNEGEALRLLELVDGPHEEEDNREVSGF